MKTCRERCSELIARMGPADPKTLAYRQGIRRAGFGVVLSHYSREETLRLLQGEETQRLLKTA